jgi:hypothetical protein
MNPSPKVASKHDRLTGISSSLSWTLCSRLAHTRLSSSQLRQAVSLSSRRALSFFRIQAFGRNLVIEPSGERKRLGWASPSRAVVRKQRSIASRPHLCRSDHPLLSPTAIIQSRSNDLDVRVFQFTFFEFSTTPNSCLDPVLMAHVHSTGSLDSSDVKMSFVPPSRCISSTGSSSGPSSTTGLSSLSHSSEFVPPFGRDIGVLR